MAISTKKKKRKVTVLDKKPIPVKLTDKKYHENYRYACNWTARNIAANVARKELLFWMKNNKYSKSDIASVKSLPDWKYFHAGHLGYLANDSWEFREETWSYLKREIEKAISEGQEYKKKIKKEQAKKSKIDKIKEENKEKPEMVNFKEAQEITDDIQDTISSDFEIEEIKLQNLFKGKKIVVIDMSLEKLKSLKEEYELIGKDDQVTEAYGFLKKTHIKRTIKAYDESIKVAESAKLNKTVGRIKKSKPKTASVQVQKFKYKEKDKQYNLVSVNPIDLIGAKKATVFNCKTRKLGIYYSNSENGFTAKGTTLQGFDEKMSQQKTLRNTKDSSINDKLVNFRKAPVKKVDKMFDEINTTSVKMNGRFNNDVVILKVYK